MPSLSKEQQPPTPLSHRDQVRQTVYEYEKERYKHSHKIEFEDCRSTIHPGIDCLPFSLSHFLRIIPTCYAFYSPIHFIPILLFKRRQLFSKRVFEILWKFFKNTTKSVLFCCAYQSIMTLSMCIGNRCKVMNVGNVLVSGFNTGLSVLFEASSRRIEMALYFFTRAAFAISDWLKNDCNVISEKKLQQIYNLLFCFASGLLCMLYFHYPKSLKASIKGLLRYIVA